MSDIKFSEFTEFTSETENMEYVGFDGIQNFRIKKDNTKKSILPLLNIYGYSIAHDTDTDHDIAFGSGVCSDSTGAYLLSGSASVKRIDASWSAGTGNGGLFSGSVGNNTVYYLFVIRKDSDGSIDYGFDTSITAANIPAGYTYYRCIGWVITNGSANIADVGEFGSQKIEFAANSQASANTNDTTSFLNNAIDGTGILNNTTKTYYYVKFLTPIYSGDKITIEVKSIVGEKWVDISYANAATMGSTLQANQYGGNPYGIGINIIDKYTIKVFFQHLAFFDTAASGQSWATLKALGDGYTKWRVKKVSVR